MMVRSLKYKSASWSFQLAQQPTPKKVTAAAKVLIPLPLKIKLRILRVRYQGSTMKLYLTKMKICMFVHPKCRLTNYSQNNPTRYITN